MVKPSARSRHATKKSAAQLDAEIAEMLGRVPFGVDPEIRAKWHIDPSELRVGQRFDYFGRPFEIVKIGRDKDKTIQIAHRYTKPSGRDDFLDHRSFPLRQFYQQHLRPIRDKSSRGPSHATKRDPSKPYKPPTWKQMAADYKRRAAAAKREGGKVVRYPHGDLLILPVEGASEYYYSDWQADELLEKTKRENAELLEHMSIEDLLLAQSQGW